MNTRPCCLTHDSAHQHGFSSPPPPPALQVLSVDDDPVNQMVIQAMLGKAGFKVLKAADGQKALDLLEVRGCGRALSCALPLLCCAAGPSRKRCYLLGSILPALHLPAAWSAHCMRRCTSAHGPVMRANTEHLSLNQRRVRQHKPMRPRTACACCCAVTPCTFSMCPAGRPALAATYEFAEPFTPLPLCCKCVFLMPTQPTPAAASLSFLQESLRQGDPPHVMLLDVMMPGLSGWVQTESGKEWNQALLTWVEGASWVLRAICVTCGPLAGCAALRCHVPTPLETPRAHDGAQP